MPATSTDQVAWLSCNVTVGGEQKRYARDELLPPAASPDEAAERAVLRLGGALRPVEVYYEPGEEGAPEAAQAEVTAPGPRAETARPAETAPARAAAAPVIVGAEDDTPPARTSTPPRRAGDKRT